MSDCGPAPWGSTQTEPVPPAFIDDSLMARLWLPPLGLGPLQGDRSTKESPLQGSDGDLHQRTLGILIMLIGTIPASCSLLYKQQVLTKQRWGKFSPVLWTGPCWQRAEVPGAGGPACTAGFLQPC